VHQYPKSHFCPNRHNTFQSPHAADFPAITRVQRADFVSPETPPKVFHKFGYEFFAFGANLSSIVM
jgi:hypothetical protein